MNGLSILIVEIYCIHKFAVDIELLMRCSPVADTNGATPSVSLKMVERSLRYFCLSMNGKHDGQAAIGKSRVNETLHDELHVGVGLGFEPKT